MPLLSHMNQQCQWRHLHLKAGKRQTNISQLIHITLLIHLLLHEGFTRSGWRNYWEQVTSSKYLGKVHKILLILWFISFGKEKVLSYRIYSGYMVACERQTYYLSSLLSLQKTNFCREATIKNMSVVHRLDIWKNALFVFFLLLIR